MASEADSSQDGHVTESETDSWEEAIRKERLDRNLILTGVV